MGKAELLEYLANLVVLDDYLDDRGVNSAWLRRESMERFGEYQKIIEEEQKKADEAGKSKQQHEGAEEGADSEGRLARRS